MAASSWPGLPQSPLAAPGIFPDRSDHSYIMPNEYHPTDDVVFAERPAPCALQRFNVAGSLLTGPACGCRPPLCLLASGMLHRLVTWAEAAARFKKRGFRPAQEVCFQAPQHARTGDDATVEGARSTACSERVCS